MKEFDVLIIGSGISGLVCAIESAENGFSVALISKEHEMIESNTRYAQGGIVAGGDTDSSELLARDIVLAGDSLSRTKAVNQLAERAPSYVESFLVDKIGIAFDKDADGSYNFTKEAAHSTRRILHAKDKTGYYIEQGLYEYAKKKEHISFFPRHSAIDIITNTHHSTDTQARYRTSRALGAYILNQETGEVERFFAPATVLAAGGTGNLFLHTSNSVGATGDGIAMAYRAGVTIINAEYIQFHPTILYHRDVKRFLITEALRGEGARLQNIRGDYFMDRYSPEMKELAPRDVVARAIYQEMEATNSSYVFLDTAKMEIDLDERFPGISAACREIGLDFTREPIPVVPAAHYSCGGVKTDIKGKTSIKGLYSIGETACTGLHGSNRLASVSLLEGLYSGIEASRYIKKRETSLTNKDTSPIPEWVSPSHEETFDKVLIHHDMLNIQMTMWDYVGILRTKKRLQRALSDLTYLMHRVERFYKEAKLTKEIIELRNAVLTASIITRSALSNPHSRGCHYIE